MNDGKGLRIYHGAGDCCACLATVAFEDLWKEMPPCSRLAEYAAVPFRIEEWKKTGPAAM